MKKNLLLSITAMLLMCVSAFAQNGEMPQKGDVNEDGKVDVADINAVIKIMKDGGGTAEAPTYYWYVGKDEELLGKNGTSYNLDLSNFNNYKVSSINNIYTDSQNVGDADNNIYVLCPTEWVDQFKLTDLDNNEIPQTDKTSQIISGVTGYSILRGTGKVMDSIIKVVQK